MSIETDFHTICTRAQPANRASVSLYMSVPFYGGPEEGGWWGADTVLVATQSYPTAQAADKARREVLALAGESNKAARAAYGDQCIRESDWLEARGLEDDALPEVDGPDNYFVVVEAVQGSMEEEGNRRYE